MSAAFIGIVPYEYGSFTKYPEEINQMHASNSAYI